jgi:predicted transcriptional regulator
MLSGFIAGKKEAKDHEGIQQRRVCAESLDFSGESLDEVIPISAIAECIHVQVHYLEQILLQLKAKGFVNSKQGMHGGYQLRTR